MLPNLQVAHKDGLNITIGKQGLPADQLEMTLRIMTHLHVYLTESNLCIVCVVITYMDSE